MRMGRVVCVGLMVVMGVGAMGDSATAVTPASPARREADWSALEKLGHGFGNVLTGWMEIPLAIHARWNSKDTIASLFGGDKRITRTQ